MTTTMRAAQYERTGPAPEVLTLVDRALPLPAAGEVRVKLAYSGVNPSDVKSRAGVRSKVLAFPQIIPHSDGAGVIDAVGAGVDASRVGERVWIWNGAWARANGTAAQFIALPAAQAVQLPDHISFAAGACLGIPAITGLHGVVMDGGVAGKVVLVAGGAGAVGRYAIQFAKLMGAALVISTVSSEAKAAIARAAGADLIINYKTQDVAQACLAATGGRGVDRIIEVDFAANAARDFAAVRAEGDIVVYGSGAAEVAVPFFPAILKNVRVRFYIVYNLNAADRERANTALNGFLRGNVLTHQVALVLPLEEIAQAHALVERGEVVGNVVLKL
jgi:NADPH:quinone reductase